MSLRQSHHYTSIMGASLAPNTLAEEAVICAEENFKTGLPGSDIFTILLQHANILIISSPSSNFHLLLPETTADMSSMLVVIGVIIGSGSGGYLVREFGVYSLYWFAVAIVAFGFLAQLVVLVIVRSGRAKKAS